MANQEQLQRLQNSVEDWNAWRKQHREIQPDLSRADLSGTRLGGANLFRTDLSGANLTAAKLGKAAMGFASLVKADLSGAQLTEADLSGANLGGAELYRTKLYKTIFAGATVFLTTFADVDLRTVQGLETVLHQGPAHGHFGGLTARLLASSPVRNDIVSSMRAFSKRVSSHRP